VIGDASIEININGGGVLVPIPNESVLAHDILATVPLPPNALTGTALGELRVSNRDPLRFWFVPDDGARQQLDPPPGGAPWLGAPWLLDIMSMDTDTFYAAAKANQTSKRGVVHFVHGCVMSFVPE
jgi:hypothetical protein